MLRTALSPWLAALAGLIFASPALAQRSTPQQVLDPVPGSNQGLGSAVAVQGDTMVVGAWFDTVGANSGQGSAFVYRWTGSAWTLEATLTASDGAANDSFGDDVAIDGDTIVVGAWRDDIGAATDRGSVYVYTRTPGGTTWTQQAKLIASDGAAGDEFGESVDLSGNTVVVGARRATIGANGFQGAAYVFTRAGTTWTQRAKLTASDGASSDIFGGSVAISGDSIVVGAPQDDVGAIIDQGSAYIFTRTPGSQSWTQQAKLVASDGAANDQFGYSVAIDGNSAVVGAWFDGVGANSSQGSAYVFTRSGTAWSQEAKLTASDGSAFDNFGNSVAIDGDSVAVGAQADNLTGAIDAGSAYVFTRAGSVWTQQAQITAPDAATSDFFGNAVAIDGDQLVIGAIGDNLGFTDQGSAWAFSRIGSKWIGPDLTLVASDGTFLDNFGISVAISGNTAIVGAYNDDVGANGNQGSAYIFVRTGVAWTQQAQLLATDGALSDLFGYSVAISGDTAVVGALLDDVGANTNQGSAYVFVRSGTTWTQQAVLTASDGLPSDDFGISVAIAGNTVIVGAAADDIGANTNQGSAYVFTRSGTSWSQQAKLTATGGAAFDVFGSAVALDGDTALIGADGDDVGANPNQGSVYVFTRSGTSWSQQALLTASDGAAGDAFGNAVALSGDTALVGAFLDTTGTNLNQGSAYVFVRSGTSWSQQAKLSDLNGAASDFFGISVAIEGDTAVVAAYGEDVGANTDQGAVVVFNRSGSTWNQQALLSAPGGGTSDNFGYSTALSGNTLIVGAFLDNIGANTDQGSASIFDIPADEFALATNNSTGAVFSSLSAAMLPAVTGHQITATEAAWRSASNLNSLGRSLALLSSGNLRSPSTSALDLGGASVVSGLAGAVDIFGQLRTASNASADLYADRFRLGSRGILTARTGSSLTINAPVANLDGQTRLEQNASMTFAGSATAIGPTTANLNASLTAGDTFTNLDTFTITSGTISAPLFLNRDAANIFGTSALFGSYTNDAGATTTIRSGTLFVFGSLTNNGTIVGTICAGCAGSPPTLDLTGSLVLGPDANLTMPFQDALVRLGGDFDAAITNHLRYNMAQATLQFEGTGAPQTLEAMSVDRGQDITALDRTIAGNFPIGTLRVGPNPSFVATVDSRDNDGLGQSACEAIYVDTLIIEAGSTLDTSKCVTIYYSTLINNGTVTDETKLVPIQPCAADFDGSGFLDSDDFVFYLEQFTRGCVGPGEDVFGPNPSCVKSADFDQSGFVDADDFVAYLAAFEVGC